MDLGHAIKLRRKKMNQTQAEFAFSCGITQTYLSQIECNHKDPNLSTIKTISEKLSIPIPILFFLAMTDDDVQENKRAAFKMVNPAIQSLVNEFFTS